MNIGLKKSKQILEGLIFQIDMMRNPLKKLTVIV
jgi:hypothetical protein